MKRAFSLILVFLMLFSSVLTTRNVYAEDEYSDTDDDDVNEVVETSSEDEETSSVQEESDLQTALNEPSEIELSETDEKKADEILIEEADSSAEINEVILDEQKDIIETGSCGTNGNDVTYTIYNDNSMVISGTGYMKDYYYWGPHDSDEPEPIDAPWHSYPITNVSVEDDVKSVGIFAFYNCTSLESVTLSDSVEFISWNAFSGCNSLKTINIPDSIYDIGSEAFSDCASLKSIYIPESVTSIGSRAFKNCSSLASIRVSSGNAEYDSRNDCDAIIDTNNSELIVGGNLTVIPDGILSIADYAFSGRSSLQSVTIPDSIELIGIYAFSDCVSLKTVNFPDYSESFSEIRGYAFSNCTSLLTINIPGPNTEVYPYAFAGCTSLESAVLPDSTTIIRGGLFSNCTSLNSIIIPDSVDIIGGRAFFGCVSLTSINIPDGVTWIGEYAFSDCSSLASIVINNPDVILYDGAFKNCSSLTTLKLPVSATVSGNAMREALFEGVNSLKMIQLTKGRDEPANYEDGKYQYTPWYQSRYNDLTVVLDEGITSIGDYMFYGCEGLSTILIPDSVSDIGDHAFTECSSLSSVYIPDTTGNIDAYAFGYMSDDESDIGGFEIYTGASDKMTGWNEKWCHPSVRIHYNVSREEYYSDSYAYAILNNEGELVFFRSSEEYENHSVQTIAINSEEISGTVFSGFETGAVSWEESKGSIKSVYVADGFKVIPKNLSGWFNGCTNLIRYDSHGFDTSNARNMDLLFSNCSSLTYLDLSSFDTSKTENMDGMFDGCTSLTELVLGPEFTVWCGGDLPEGVWHNIEKGLSLNSHDLRYEYPENASEWDGKWIRATKPVEEVYFDRSIISIAVSDILHLDAVILPEDATLKNLRWYSSDENVASVDQNGNVSALSFGSAMIYAEALDDTFEAYGKCEIRVYEAENLWLGEFEYTKYDTVSGNAIKITLDKHIGTKKDLTIVSPVVLNGASYDVYLGERLFYRNQIVENLTFSGQVEFPEDSSFMFAGDYDAPASLKTIVVPYDVYTYSVHYMDCMFSNCSSLSRADLHGFNTNNVTDMYGLFENCSSLTDLNISNFNTSKVTNMGSMFEGCSSLRTLSIGNFNTSRVTSMAWMFSGCSSLESINLNGFRTDNVKYMDAMFQNCSSLRTVNLGGFNTFNVERMSEMFNGCGKLMYLDLNSFDTSSVLYMDEMFGGCSSLKELNISSFDTQRVTDMSRMFSGCSSLEQIDVGRFDTSSVERMNSMFENCSSLKSIDLSGFRTGNVMSMYNMFGGCFTLQQVILGKYFIKWVDEAYLPCGIWTNGTQSLLNTELYSQYPDHSFDWYGIWNRTAYTISVNVEDITVFEGDGWYYWSDDPNDRILIYNYSIQSASVDTTKEKLSGYVEEISRKFEELYGYIPEYGNGGYKKQIAESGWGLGTHTDFFYFDGVKTEFDVNIVQSCIESITVEPVVIVKGDGWRSGAYENDGHWIYDVFPSHISVKMTDGQEFNGEFSDVIERLRMAIDSKYVNAYFDYYVDSNQEAEWDIGIHEASIRICGKEATYNVEIIENPIEEVSFGKLYQFYGATLTKSTYIYNEGSEDYERIEYGVYDVTPRTMSVKAFGEQYSGKVEEACNWLQEEFKKNGLTLSNGRPTVYDDGQSYEETWGIGLHTAKISFMGQTYTLDVEVISNPLSDLAAENISIPEDQYSKYYSNYNTWYRYYENIDPVRISVCIDGQKYIGDLYGVVSMIENRYDVNIPYELISNQTHETEWGIGNHAVTLKLGGLETDYTVTIVPKGVSRTDDVRFIIESTDVKSGTILNLSCSTPGASIFYAFNYSDDFMLYEDVIVLKPQNEGDESLTVSAYAVADGISDSSLRSFTFRFIDGTKDHGDIVEDDLDYYLDNVNKCQGLWISPIQDEEYTGKAITPTIRVYDGTKLLIQNIDYTVKYANNTKVGSATVTITGKGSYVGTLTKTFNIQKKRVVLNDIPDLTLVYTGKDLTVAAPKVFFGTIALKNNTDFNWQIKENPGNTKVKEKGIYHVLVSPAVTSNYTFDEMTYEVEVTESGLYKISAAKLAGFVSKFDYDGTEKKQNIILSHNGRTLVQGKDYELYHYNTLNPGTATLVIKGINDYFGTIVKEFKINRLKFSNATVTVNGLEASYPYESIVEPEVSVLYKGNLLVKDRDYSLSYKNNAKVGKATLSVTGIGNYEGSINKTYTITALSINDLKKYKAFDCLYEKGGVKSDVYIYNGEIRLVSGKDYTLSYKNNTKPGKATVTVKGKGNYVGTYSNDFMIYESKLEYGLITVSDKVFVNKANNYTTTVTIADYANGKKLAAGTDYDKNFRYYYVADTVISGQIRKRGSDVQNGDVVPVGTVLGIEISGKGYYSGSAYALFRIVSGDVSKATVKIPDQYYTGKPIMLRKSDISAKIGTKSLNNCDYEIVSYSNNIAKGTAQVTIKGTGDYGGTKTVSFKIMQKSLGITVHFDPNSPDATGTMKDQLIYKSQLLINNVYKRAGYTFVGWIDDEGNTYNNKDQFIYDESKAGMTVVLHAVWSKS